LLALFHGRSPPRFAPARSPDSEPARLASFLPTRLAFSLPGFIAESFQVYWLKRFRRSTDMLPIAATIVRQQMMDETPVSAAEVARARRDLAADLDRVRDRARRLDRAAALIEQATADGLRTATSDGERAETLRASALHARQLATG
jgi:hypothetical protein